MDKEEDLKKRNEIFELVAQYVNSMSFEKFIPGKTWIRYAGRVFDAEEYLSLVDAALDGWITAGRYSEEFEFQFAKYLGIYPSMIVNSGSSVNLIALSSLTSPSLGKDRLKTGDEVITVAAGFPTTVNPIVQNDAVPVFVDIEEGTYNIDVSEIESAISEKTRAIMVAHTLGNPFDIDKILRIAKDHGLYLVEDNCDALSSRYKGINDEKTSIFHSAKYSVESTRKIYPKSMPEYIFVSQLLIGIDEELYINKLSKSNIDPDIFYQYIHDFFIPALSQLDKAELLDLSQNCIFPKVEKLLNSGVIF